MYDLRNFLRIPFVFVASKKFYLEYLCETSNRSSDETTCSQIEVTCRANSWSFEAQRPEG